MMSGVAGNGVRVSCPPPPPCRRIRVVPWRLAVVTAGLVAVVSILWLLVVDGVAGMPLRCAFHDWTGLHCPGCGLTRATDALLHGRVLDAIGFNVLGVVLLPVALVGVTLETIGWVIDAPPPWRISPGHRVSTAIAIAVIVFSVARNLPWPPFCWLAPIGC